MMVNKVCKKVKMSRIAATIMEISVLVIYPRIMRRSSNSHLLKTFLRMVTQQ